MTNWHSIIKEIEASGLTVAEIATRCNAKRTTVSDIRFKRTKEPRHSLGESLLDLHKRISRGKK